LINIYTNDKDKDLLDWLDKLSKDKKWSLSQTIKELLQKVKDSKKYRT